MKIVKFTISRYGPLNKFESGKLGSFNLFYGKNEEGKTLLLDALIKILFNKASKKKRKLWEENIERVDEKPEGYVIIGENGDQKKLPEDGDLTSIFDITPEDGRNIFIIRDSDLLITEEEKHYTTITERLTGLRTAEIEAIIKNLLELGKITPSGEFSNKSPDYLKEKLQKARELIKKINELREKYKLEEIETEEKRITDLRHELREIEKKLNLLDQAKKKEKYEKGTNSLSSLKEYLEEVAKLEKINEKDEEIWRRGEEELEQLTEKKEKRKLELKEKQNKLDKMMSELERAEKVWQRISNLKKQVDEELKVEISSYEKQIYKFKAVEPKEELYNKILIGSGLFFIAAIISLIFASSTFTKGAVVVLFFYFLYSIWKKYQIAHQKGELQSQFENLKLKCSKLGLAGETLSDINMELKKLEDDFTQKQEHLSNLRSKLNYLKAEIDKLQSELIPETEAKIQEITQKIEKIKEVTRIKTLHDFQKKLDKKKEYKSKIDKEITILTDNFGSKGETIEQKIDYWREQVAAYEEYQDKASRIEYIEYSEKEETRLKTRQNMVSNELEDKEAKLQRFKMELKDIERETNNILKGENEYYFCETTRDVENIELKLGEFIRTNERNKELILKAKEIFEEIKSEEEKRLTDLFGEKSLISRYFWEITDRYQKVDLSPEEMKIYVTHQNGQKLEASCLSGGTYDQLYLAIRLGLGIQLLKGRKGFFLMDDPFIKSDIWRLKNQLNILKKLAGDGWQIIYFSAKEEVKQLLEKDIKSGEVNLHTVPGLDLGSGLTI